MVAADGSIGGFNGEGNPESDPVHKKRRLLEEEGVQFKPDGRVNAVSIHKLPENRVSKPKVKDEVVGSSLSLMSGVEGSAAAHCGDPSVKGCTASCDDELQKAILELLSSRAEGKTC